LPGRIEKSFVRQVDLLPPETRSLLLIAAAEPVGDPLLVWRPRDSGSAAPAVETEALLTIGERLTFRHPSARSAVHRSASVRERRAAHLALAEVTEREVDPDRRAWHLATAASGPDEDLALELEQSAAAPRLAPGFAAEAAFLHRCLSNPEVGGRLFISPRTVEWHLRKVFARLEISSRKELRTALRARSTGSPGQLRRRGSSALRRGPGGTRAKGSPGCLPGATRAVKQDGPC
jgi:hypothetical protein